MAVTGDAWTGRPTALPTRKAACGGIAGTLVTSVVWFYDACGLPGAPVPPETAAALATLACFAASYATAPAPIETVLPNGDEGPVRQHG